MNFELSPEQSKYIHRLAYRYVQYRKSSSIDVEDLKSAAAIRWWRFCTQHENLEDERVLQICFYQQVKGAMRDIVRDSTPVKVTRTMRSKLQAYQQPYTVELDHAIDVYAGEAMADPEIWMDVVNSLKKLSERDQLILSLYFEQGFNFSEIAEILELSVSTITRAYQRSLDILKKDLRKSENDAKKSRI